MSVVAANQNIFSTLRYVGLPNIRDPRYLQLAVLFAYAIVAREAFFMDRPHWVTVGACMTAVSIDILLGVFLYKVIRFPVSALIIGLACSLLIDSRLPWVYFVAAALASLSKALFIYSKRHYFNPANFGVVMTLLLIPYHATGMPSLFGGFVAPSIVFFCIGLLTICYAKQIAVPLAWLAGFFIFGFCRAYLLDAPTTQRLMPALSPTFLLFTFHMISDPATTPRGTRARIFYGLSVAFIDACFRVLHIPYGNFYALFMMGALLPMVRDWEEKHGVTSTVPVPSGTSHGSISKPRP